MKRGEVSLIINWLDVVIRLLDSFLIAIPLWFFWTKVGIGSTLFLFLPAAWLSVSFVEWWGLIFIFTTTTSLLSSLFQHKQL